MGEEGQQEIHARDYELTMGIQQADPFLRTWNLPDGYDPSLDNAAQLGSQFVNYP